MATKNASDAAEATEIAAEAPATDAAATTAVEAAPEAPAPAPVPEGHTRVRVRYKSGGMISTGERGADNVDITYPAGAVLTLPTEIATALLERDLVDPSDD